MRVDDEPQVVRVARRGRVDVRDGGLEAPVQVRRIGDCQEGETVVVRRRRAVLPGARARGGCMAAGSGGVHLLVALRASGCKGQRIGSTVSPAPKAAGSLRTGAAQTIVVMYAGLV